MHRETYKQTISTHKHNYRKFIFDRHKNFYVRTDGSDSNDGSANTAAGAFRTIQKALNYVATNYNVDRFVTVINIASGLYEERVTLPKYNSTTGYTRLQGAGMGLTRLAYTDQHVMNNVVSAGTFNIHDMSIELVS